MSVFHPYSSSCSRAYLLHSSNLALESTYLGKKKEVAWLLNKLFRSCAAWTSSQIARSSKISRVIGLYPQMVQNTRGSNRPPYRVRLWQKTFSSHLWSHLHRYWIHSHPHCHSYPTTANWRQMAISALIPHTVRWNTWKIKQISFSKLFFSFSHCTPPSARWMNFAARNKSSLSVRPN